MHKFRLIIFALLVLAPARALVLAQSTKGFIIGEVTERSSGQPVAGATILVRGVANTTTDETGAFRLELASGAYDVEISASGFAPIKRNQVGVTGGRNTVLNVSLDVTISENVEVRSEIFAENMEQRVSNTTMSRDDIRATPGTGGDPCAR